MAAGAQTKHDLVFVSFTAEISQTTSESLLGLCANLATQRVGTVYLLLSTPGGSVSSGITIYNTLRAMPFKLVTHNTGSVNSIGNAVFLAGEERYACPNATFMFHGVGLDVQNRRFEQKDLRETLGMIVAEQTKIGAVITERTKISADEVGQLFLEAVTRDPDYARDKGIIQEIRDVQIPPGVPVHQFVFKR